MRNSRACGTIRHEQYQVPPTGTAQGRSTAYTAGEKETRLRQSCADFTWPSDRRNIDLRTPARLFLDLVTRNCQILFRITKGPMPLASGLFRFGGEAAIDSP